MQQQVHAVDLTSGITGVHGDVEPAVTAEAVARILLGARRAVVEVPPVGDAAGGMLCTRRELDRERGGSGVDVGVGVCLELALGADEESLLLLLTSPAGDDRDKTQPERD